MIDPKVLRALQAAGATTDMIIAAIEADAVEENARRERKRANNRERQRRFREARNADNALHDVTERDARDHPLDKKNPQTPEKLNPRESNILPACETLDLPEGVTAGLWSQYRAMRRKIRKPLSPHAEQLALKRLRQFAEDGHPPGGIVEAAIVGSYQGLFPEKGRKNGHHANGHEWGSTVSAAEALIAELNPGSHRESEGRTGTSLARTGH